MAKVEIDETRFERLVQALENATNAINRLAANETKKGVRIHGSIKKRARPAAANDTEVTDDVRMQVDRAMKRLGR